MNLTPEQWSEVNPDAVASGSWAQARNVLEMAQQDIARLARAAQALQSIAEFCSGDDRTLGAVGRLAEIRKIAVEAIAPLPSATRAKKGAPLPSQHRSPAASDRTTGEDQ